jgi:hypothetical protein
MSSKTNQSSYLEQTSPDNPVFLTNGVTRHLLRGHVPVYGGSTGKIERYAAIGTTVILGDFTVLEKCIS